MIIRQFYEKLGSFLFALSKVDGLIQKREEDTLMEEILRILEEHPGFEKNAEVQDLLLTKLCYYNSEKQPKSVDESTRNFLKFLEQNKSHISDLSKGIAMRLIRKVATANKGISKQEQKLVRDVTSILLKEPNPVHGD